MTAHARIVGWGKYLPERVMPNTELEGMVDTSDEWIRGRSGIGARRLPAAGEPAASLGLAAAREALAAAQVDPADLDLIIVGTSTPDHYAYPSPACLIQAALGGERAGAVELSASCSGFVYGLGVGAQFIQTDASALVLVIGFELN